MITLVLSGFFFVKKDQETKNIEKFTDIDFVENFISCFLKFES